MTCTGVDEAFLSSRSAPDHATAATQLYAQQTLSEGATVILAADVNELRREALR